MFTRVHSLPAAVPLLNQPTVQQHYSPQDGICQIIRSFQTENADDRQSPSHSRISRISSAGEMHRGRSSMQICSTDPICKAECTTTSAGPASKFFAANNFHLLHFRVSIVVARINRKSCLDQHKRRFPVCVGPAICAPRGYMLPDIR